MKPSWKSELPMWLVIAGMFALAVITWSGAPDRLPVHWNVHQQVDRYGGRLEGLLAMPLVTLGLYVLMLILPRVDPGRANYAAFQGAFTTLRLAIVVFMAAMYAVTHLWMRGIGVRMETVMPLLMGALFIVVGNLLGKVRPNWFIGIRTPWTLSSKDAWARAHREGGWVFIGGGVILMIAGLVRSPWAFPVAIGAFVAGLLGVVVHSYFVWRADPDKVPPAGTSPA